MEPTGGGWEGPTKIARDHPVPMAPSPPSVQPAAAAAAAANGSCERFSGGHAGGINSSLVDGGCGGATVAVTAVSVDDVGRMATGAASSDGGSGESNGQ